MSTVMMTLLVVFLVFNHFRVKLVHKAMLELLKLHDDEINKLKKRR